MNNKPIILIIEEAKQELIQSVNDVLNKYQIPYYFIEPTFSELYSQIKAMSQRELAQAREQVEAAQAVSTTQNGDN